MVLQTYEQDGLMWLTNVNGPAGADKEAFRGDLVIEFGDMHESSQTRNPPKKVFEQVVLEAEGGKIGFLAGYLSDLGHLDDLVERFKSDFAEGATVVVFCFNIDDPMQVTVDGVSVACFPMTEGLVWNELLDMFYIEKSDLKGLSPEEKVVAVAEAKGELSPKGDVLDFVAAAAKTNGQVRAYDGPV